jgi:hypothetical protein
MGEAATDSSVNCYPDSVQAGFRVGKHCFGSESPNPNPNFFFFFFFKEPKSLARDRFLFKDRDDEHVGATQSDWQNSKNLIRTGVTLARGKKTIKGTSGKQTISWKSDNRGREVPGC